MKSFEDWYETIDDCAFDDMICAMGIAFEAGQQSKQAEIDELKKRIDKLEWFAKGVRNWDAHPKDLGLSGGPCGVRDFYRNYATNILKGNTNED